MAESKEAGQCRADSGDVKIEFEGAEPEVEVDTSERVFKNKCVHTRANIENKVYRMFSLVY